MCNVSQYNPQKAVLPVEVRSGMQQRARTSSRHDVDAKRYQTVMMRIPLMQYPRPGSTGTKNV